MTRRQDEILDLIQLETGKVRLHAYEEFLDGAGSTLYYARKAPGLLRTHRRGGAFPVFTQTSELQHPRGVVTTISPWNYPFALSMDVVPALLAGNAVVASRTIRRRCRVSGPGRCSSNPLCRRRCGRSCWETRPISVTR